MTSLRILIDLQAAQNNSRARGIGRYSTELTKGIIRNAGEHQVFILLSNLFPEMVDAVRSAFVDILPSDRFLVFNAPKPVAELFPENTWRRRIAELLREHFIDSIGPDVTLLASTIEGAVDDTITSIGRLTTTSATAAIIYDLIPLIEPELYLKSKEQRDWYHGKLEALRRADLLLAISQATVNDAIRLLQVGPGQAVNISAAASSAFRSPPQSGFNCGKFGITKSFIMHSSAFDSRKNFQGLMRAYAALPRDIGARYQLVLVCKLEPKDRHDLTVLADDLGIPRSDLILPGFVTDEELASLYGACHLFVFPSLTEGFGLPALEAMSCGTPTIGSNIPAVAEVIGWSEALFEASSIESIASLIAKALTDDGFYASLKTHAKLQASQFSWDASAARAISSFEKLALSRAGGASALDQSQKRRALFAAIGQVSKGYSPTDIELLELARIINDNDLAVTRLQQTAGFA